MWKVMLQVLVSSWLVQLSQVEPQLFKVVGQKAYRYFLGHFDPGKEVYILNLSVIFLC